MNSINSFKRILIVDDEPDLLEILHFYFSEAGFESSVAKNVDEATNFILNSLESDTRPDIILTDVRMPRKSGLDLARWVQEKKLKIPIVLFTGFTDVTKAEASEFGILKILTKPMSAPEIVSEIISVLPPLSLAKP